MDKLVEIREALEDASVYDCCGDNGFICDTLRHKDEFIDRAFKLINELIEESKWQPIESATKGRFVLLASFFEDESSVDTGIVCDNSPYYDQGFTVTHWKPLPQPPMGESND